MNTNSLRAPASLPVNDKLPAAARLIVKALRNLKPRRLAAAPAGRLAITDCP